MRVIIDLEIETSDYGGEEFKKEVETLLKDIDSDTRLTKFRMRSKYDEYFTDGIQRDIDWKEENYRTHD